MGKGGERRKAEEVSGLEEGEEREGEWRREEKRMKGRKRM